MLVFALILGELFKRLKLPTLIGHLLAGVIVGSSFFNIIELSESFEIVVDLAMFFVMFYAGLQLRPEQIRKAGKNSVILSLLSFAIPFLLVSSATYLLGFPLITSLLVGLILAITAIPVSAVVLMEFGLLKSRLGTTVITAGIIDDVLSLIVFAIIIQLSVNGMTDINYGETIFSIVKITAFLGGIFLLDFLVKKVMEELPNRFDSFSRYLGTKEAGFGLLLISAFGLSWLAEAVGLHFIIGTFFAGLIIYKEVIGKENFDRVNSVFSAITFGLFSPIFFAFIGTKFNPQSIFEFLPFFLILLGSAAAGKILGGYIGGRIAGFSNIQSITIGNLVNSRGMVEIVIASIALELGLIDIAIFSVVVAVGIITIVMSPILAKLSIQRFAMEKRNGQR